MPLSALWRGINNLREQGNNRVEDTAHEFSCVPVYLTILASLFGSSTPSPSFSSQDGRHTDTGTRESA